MDGTYSDGLIDATSLSKPLAAGKSLVSKRVFDWERTIDAEIAGVEMITTVLQKCMDALVRARQKRAYYCERSFPL